jgi:outer membrane protein assembly factor BamB
MQLRHYILASLLLTCSVIFGQENVFTIRIRNTQNKPMANVVVTGAHANGSLVLKATTNVNGEAVFKLPQPGTYTFSYLEVQNAASTEVKEGYFGTFTRTVTYDPKGVFAEKPRGDRKGIVFKEVGARQLKGQPNIGEITILVKRQDKSLVTNTPVKMVSIADKTRYSTNTNAAGEAVFFIPVGKEYEIDVDQSESFRVLTIPNHAGLKMTEVVFYEKTTVKETVKGDTIIQPHITQTNGTSTHVLFTLNLNNFEGKPLADEPIFMRALNGKRVYQSKTDEKGVCTFLLEKGTDYVLNFKYEQNVHLVEAPASQGFHTASATRRYRGSAEIEAMLRAQEEEMRRIAEERKRMEEEMLKKIESDKKLAEEFRKKALIPVQPITTSPVYKSTPVESLSAPANYLKKTPAGYDISFDGNSGPGATPTVADNKLFTQQGMYSSNFYCMQAGTGGFVWGLELGESGLSPAVYHQGVILINTYSCTLYAIDAATGKLLWSKWLAGTVYSTPTAIDDDVLVVYKHGGKPVVVSFGLRTGNFNWMQDLDAEAFACPVVDGNEVHVTTQNGTYYIFNKETGVRTVVSKDVAALSSPAITADKVFVTAIVKGEEKLVALDRKTLEVKQVFNSPVDAIGSNGSVQQMHFNGSHPVVYQNKYIVLTDRGNLYTFSAETEQKLWSQPINVTQEQVPVIANNTVYIVTQNGTVMSYDLVTGQPKTLHNGSPDKTAEGQPVSSNGFLFIAAAGVLHAIKTVTKIDWNQWNKDAGHNTVYR